MPYDLSMIALGDALDAYHLACGDWGVLREVISLGKVEDADVERAIELAKERRDEEGERLARALLALPVDERLKFAN